MPNSKSRRKSRLERELPTFSDELLDRNRPNRSGLDPMDSYREMWYVLGRSFRDLIAGRLGRHHWYYGLFATIFVSCMLISVVLSMTSEIATLFAPVSRMRVYAPVIVEGVSDIQIVEQSANHIAIEFGYSYNPNQSKPVFVSACLLMPQKTAVEMNQMQANLCIKSRLPDTESGRVRLTIRPVLATSQSFDRIFVSLNEPDYKSSYLIHPYLYHWSP